MSMRTEAQKKCRHFRRTFSQSLYQAKALRKPSLYSPLLLTTIEGAFESYSSQNTIHFNFAIGNIPAGIDIIELRKVFEHCWVQKAGLSGERLWIEQATPENNTQWLSYITKEAERGNADTWDFENTQIPHQALLMDLS